MRIAVDAMGGDFAPRTIVEGAVLALKGHPEIDKIFLVGDAKKPRSIGDAIHEGFNAAVNI